MRGFHHIGPFLLEPMLLRILVFRTVAQQVDPGLIGADHSKPGKDVRSDSGDPLDLQDL